MWLSASQLFGNTRYPLVDLGERAQNRVQRRGSILLARKKPVIDIGMHQVVQPRLQIRQFILLLVGVGNELAEEASCRFQAQGSKAPGPCDRHPKASLCSACRKPRRRKDISDCRPHSHDVLRIVAIAVFFDEYATKAQAPPFERAQNSAHLASTTHARLSSPGMAWSRSLFRTSSDDGTSPAQCPPPVAEDGGSSPRSARQSAKRQRHHLNNHGKPLPTHIYDSKTPRTCSTHSLLSSKSVNCPTRMAQ